MFVLGVKFPDEKLPESSKSKVVYYGLAYCNICRQRFRKTAPNQITCKDQECRKEAKRQYQKNKES